MPKSLRFFTRLFGAFLSKFKGLILIGFLLGITIFLAFKFIFPNINLQKKEVIGIVGKYQAGSLPKLILSEIGEGLTKINETGNIEPNIAKSWETPDRGKSWIFHLDTNKTWQDSSYIKSEDISYNFSDAEISRPDSSTIVFRLKNEYSPFPSVVSEPVFKKGLLGTGIWKVKKLSLSGNYVQSLILSDKNGDQKIYKFYPTEDRAKLALKLGQVHILQNMYDPSPFDNWNVFKIEASPASDKIVTLFFNTKNNILSEKSVRQALAYAINKDNLPKPRAYSPISDKSWAYNPQVKTYNYDKERAKTLIGELPAEIKNNLKVDIVTTYVLLPTAEKIVKDWNEIGVKSQALVSSIIPNDYQALLAIFEIPLDPDQYTVWHSTQSSSNFSNYQNPRIDKLLEDGRAQLNLEERRKTYLDFQRFLNEDLPAVFLYYPSLYRIEKK
jgi:peptide/nickel transport system substrate-binding protein